MNIPRSGLFPGRFFGIIRAVFSSSEVEVFLAVRETLCFSWHENTTSTPPPESARDWLTQNWISPQSSSYDMFCRTPDHTGDGLSTGVISWLLDWAPIALVPPALANVSFIPSFSFLQPPVEKIGKRRSGF